MAQKGPFLLTAQPSSGSFPCGAPLLTLPAETKRNETKRNETKRNESHRFSASSCIGPEPGLANHRFSQGRKTASVSARTFEDAEEADFDRP
jgi:hypothetical protein